MGIRNKRFKGRLDIFVYCAVEALSGPTGKRTASLFHSLLWARTRVLSKWVCHFNVGAKKKAPTPFMF